MSAREAKNTLPGARGALLLFLLLGMLLLAIPARSAVADTAYDAEELQFLDLINEYRAENGLGKLVFSDNLTVAAERHNEDMGDFGFFAHDTAQSSYYAPGSEPWDRMAAEGYGYNVYKGENLAAGYATAEEAFAAWKASPSHNEAMLDGNYKVVGVSRLKREGSPFGWYWTTDFGSFVDPSARGADRPEKASERGPALEEKPRDAVRNGGFKSGEFWGQQAKDGAKLVLRGQFVRMGGYDNGRDRLEQEILVRPGTELRYELKISSVGDGDPGDRLSLKLTDAAGKPVAVPARFTGRDEAGWTERSVDLSRYAGEKLFVVFTARTDARDDTYFYLDNVSAVY